MANKYWEGVGRRKETVARVRIYKLGKTDDSANNGVKLVNDRPITDFFSELEVKYIERPLGVTELAKTFYYTVKVKGGGKTGWKDAIRLGLSRALLKYDPELKPILRKFGLVTRDPRVVERKKVGLKKARKAPRFSKR